MSRDEVVREKILDIITEWKHFWMNQTQNSKEDFENYRRRAWGIDANMKHHLADLIAKALQSPPPQQDDREARKNASQQWWDDFVSKNDNGYGIHARTIFELGWQAARSAQSDVVSVPRETWERIKSEVIEIAQHTEEPGTSAISQDLYDLIKSAEGDVSKNRQNLNISERHNEKSDDSQYVSVPKDALNELIRLVKYEAVVALEQSRMSVSLVEDIRNAIKAAEGES